MTGKGLTVVTSKLSLWRVSKSWRGDGVERGERNKISLAKTWKSVGHVLKMS